MTDQQFPKHRISWPDGLTFGLITASIAFVMELTLLPLVLSAIQDDLSLGVVELGWVFNSYAIAVAVAVLFCGFAGDRFDKRRLFMVGVVLFAGGSVLSALSGTLGTLIPSRVLQGLGGGLFFPLVPVLLTQANAERSGRILMIWGGLAGFVAAVLPMFGGILLTTFGWSAVFLCFAACAIAGLALFALGQLGQVADAMRSVPDYRKLLSIRGYWVLLTYIFLTYGCFSYYLFHYPVSWHEAGFTNRSVSLLLTTVWLSFSVVSFLLRDRMEGPGLNKSLLVAPALLALAFVIAAFDQEGPPLQLLSAVLAGTGLACCNSPSTHLLLRVSPKDLRAFSSCLDIIFARCGSVATITLLTVMDPFPALLALAVISFLAIVASHVFLRDFSRAT